MIATKELQHLLTTGGNVVAEDGTKIGSIGQVYLDDQTSQPEWVTATTGLFGTAESFVPLAQARVSGNDVVVPFDKDRVKGAPRVDDSDGHLSQDDEAELYRYYGLGYSEAASDTGLPAGQDGVITGHQDGAVGHDTSGPTTDDAMTRSEERINVGTRSEETGRVRLRKYVVTENVTKTIPVRKEKAVLEREPITDANLDSALDGPAISEEEHEVTLSEERVVVGKETVPVERVRLAKEQFTEQHTVSEEVRKEQIETEGDLEDRR
jgi:uncharacterized protein (TIGR02271 family)